MKMKSLFFITLFTFFATVEAAVNKPLLVVLLMVKDEKAVIIPTLDTYFKENIKRGQPDDEDVAYVLYDTGSTDGTEKMAEALFKKYGIKNYVIAQEPWQNFADSRNRALAIARETYPESTFILFPDAEWYFQNFDKLVKFCKDERKAYDEGTKFPPFYYRIRIMRSSYINMQPKLFLTHDDVCFVGRTQECPTKCSAHNGPEECYFLLGSSRTGYEASKKRWNRDRELLREDLEEDPTNSRAAFYLGLTEYWLENYEAAYEALQKRIKLPAFEEEDYFALYNLAEVTEILSADIPGKYSWDEALRYYLQAFTMRPHRAEPLVKIAIHYENEGNHALSYIFARRAAELPFPRIEKEILPIYKNYYEFWRWEILSRCAYYVGDFELGEKAALQAIEANPNETYLYKNLSYYWERTK